MIPTDIREWIFPEISKCADDAAVLHHDCGVDFQFRFESYTGEPFVVTEQHLKSWRTDLSKVAAQAGRNCFSYNHLQADSKGVYFDDDQNALAILFDPSTFLEHNDVEGKPLLLVIDEQTCILTGAQSSTGATLIKDHRKKAIAKSLVTIDAKWKQWITYEEAE